MAFQKTVNKTQALGSAGQISKAFHNYCNTFSAIAGDENVCVGCFVQAGTNDGEVVGASGQAITANILGVVVKDKYISSDGTEAVHIYREGDNVTILNAGNIFIEVEAEASQGQYVHLSKDAGALSFDDEIDTTGATKVYTGFRVSVGNSDPYDTDGIIEITTANA
ncbi:MAG: hypothetical protein IKB70_14235 [Bacilli bacterium]|nr:hypothetical protein [Campylobacter sp.]MBR2508003.1 hypothetical protein [Bacilli bacterium]